MKPFIFLIALFSTILVSGRAPADGTQAPARAQKLKVAVQALPSEAVTSLDGGCFHQVPYHFFVRPGDHEVKVGLQGFGLAEVPVTLSERDMFVEVRLKRNRGYWTGLTLFSLGASAVLPGVVLTIIGAIHRDTDKELLQIGAPVLGAGAALALGGGLVLAFGRERKPDVFVAPLLDLGEFKPGDGR